LRLDASHGSAANALRASHDGLSTEDTVSVHCVRVRNGTKETDFECVASEGRVT
jgi:hypothetical protein